MTAPVGTIDVAACIVRAPDGRVLMAERTPGQIAPGFWEVPGGKIDPGETPVQAAARELTEETGVQARDLRPWLAYPHRFPTRRLNLSFFLVEQWSGEPRGREGQRLAWVDPWAPHVAPVLDSNLRALFSVAAPRLYRTARSADFASPEACLAALAEACAGGQALIRLDEPRMTPDQQVIFAGRAQRIARAHGGRLLLTGSAAEARRAGVSGVHSRAAELRTLTHRPLVDVWAVECEGPADLDLARRLGADLVVVPAAVTGAAADWPAFARLAHAAAMPVYAGARAAGDQMAQALRAGGAGLAIDDLSIDGLAGGVAGSHRQAAARS